MAESSAWLPDPADRVIEVAPPDRAVHDALAAAGVTRYLALVDRPLDADVDDQLRRRTEVMTTPRTVVENNADVVVLNGPAARYLWYRRLGRAHHVLAPADGPGAREARLASRVHRRRRVGRVTWGGRAYDVIEMRHAAPPQARHYASSVVGLAALPSLLEEEGIGYAVLRWFEALPHLDPGEDLDVLVADEDLDAFLGVLEQEPGTIPVDVYTVTGIPGSDFRAMAYYPPRLAAGLLARAERQPNGFRAPAPADHFASLAYHAVYHKGFASGLPTALPRPSGEGRPDHDYGAVLAALGRGLGIDVPATMEELEELLAELGWRPPRDMLARLSQQNAWVRQRFFADTSAELEPPLLSVFLLRDKAADEATVELARAVIADHGFEVLEVHTLDAAARARCAHEIRGGNWGPGPFPTSGGDPAVAIVALHDHPTAPDERLRREHPALTNARTLEAKLAVRDRIISTVDPAARFNPLHSSDSDEDAWHYLELAHPEAVQSVRATVEARRAARRAAGGPALAPAVTPLPARVRSLLGAVKRRARATAATGARGMLHWWVGRARLAGSDR